MKMFFAFLLLLTAGAYAATCSRLENGHFRMENQFLQAEIDAMTGARCISLVDKRTQAEYTDSASDMGIGGECDWQERKMTRSVWFGKAYNVTGTKDGDIAELQCSRTGTGSIGQWMTITKIYRLPERSTELELLYDIAVQPEAMKSFRFCLWLHNSAQMKTEPTRMSFAKASGIQTLPFTPNAPINESFHYDMTDSWIAVSRLQNPSGIILQTPYENLMCFYNWQGDYGNTIEQMYRSQDIPAGKSFQTRLSMLLYNGLQAVDGSGAGVAAQFTPEGIRLYSAMDATLSVSAALRKPPELIDTPVTTSELKLQAGTTRDIPIRWPEHQGMERIIRVKTPAGIMTMRQPNAIPGYQRPPVSKRLGNDEERYGMVLLDEDACKDCYEWHGDLPLVNGRPLLKPNAGGRIRLLAVVDMMAGREAMEIAGRLDADLETCTFSTGGALGWHPAWGHSGGIPETNRFLEKLLKKDYDAILFGGQQFDTLTPRNLETILAKVQAGTAFISITPRKIPEKFTALFPVKPLKDVVMTAGPAPLPTAKSFSIAENSPLRNFPFPSLAFTPLFSYAPQEAPVVCANGQPFFATGSCGKGCTAAFTWFTGRDDNSTRAGIMPFFADEPELPWHNVFYGMVVKAIQNGIHQQPKLAISSFSASADSLMVSIENTLGREINANLLLALSQSNAAPAEKAFSISLKPGLNDVKLPHGVAVHAMLSIAEIRLMAEGLAFDFAYDTIANPNNVTITMALPEQILLAGKPAAFKAGFTGNYDKATATIKDRFGRVLATGVFNGDSVTLVPKGVVAHRAELTVELFRENRLVGSRVFVIDLATEDELERRWDNYKVMLSWPARDQRVLPFHLRSAWQNTLQNLGIDLVMSHGIPCGLWADNRAKYKLDYRYAGPLVMESITRLEHRKGLPYPQYDYRSRKKEIAELTEAFGRTKDKSLLKRFPRLDDDKYLEAYKAAMDEWMPTLLRWRPYMCDLGDEMSYGVFTSPVDFDFSPEGLAQFRIWLQKHYNGNLELLNQEWQRNFADWHEVMPDTGVEARSRNNFSSWALHRLYACGLFANFWNVVSTHARELDPGIRISASGTPHSHPYNGYDYEQLMPIVDTLIAYTGQGLAELIATYKKAPIMSWVGYGSPEASIWHSIWDNAFNGHFGVGFYSEMTMINPDLTLTPNGIHSRDAVKSLHDGIGILLYHCDSTPEVLIHYSLPSLMAAGAENNYNAFIASYGYWVRLLKERNCNPRFISPRDMASGKLNAPGVKMLVLPMSAALSDAEIAAMKAFAARGGIIVADEQPGRFNGNVAPASTERLKDIPIHILGTRLVQDATSPLMQKIAKTIDDLLPRRGLIIEAVSGQPEIHSYQLCGEGGQLFGVWAPKKTTLRLVSPAGHSFYDALKSQPVTGEVTIPAERPGVYALLPYRVNSVNCTAENHADILTVQATVMADRGKALRHVLQFTVRNASGQVLPYHTRTVNAPAGTATVAIHLASSENTAGWSVTVRDILSGATATSPVTKN